MVFRFRLHTGLPEAFILPLSSKRGGVTRGPFCSNMLLLAFCFLLLLQRPYPSCNFWLPSFWHFIDVIFLLVFWKLKSLFFKEPIVTIYFHDAVSPGSDMLNDSECGWIWCRLHVNSRVISVLPLLGEAYKYQFHQINWWCYLRNL